MKKLLISAGALAALALTHAGSGGEHAVGERDGEHRFAAHADEYRGT